MDGSVVYDMEYRVNKTMSFVLVTLCIVIHSANKCIWLYLMRNDCIVNVKVIMDEKIIKNDTCTSIKYICHSL